MNIKDSELDNVSLYQVEDYLLNHGWYIASSRDDGMVFYHKGTPAFAPYNGPFVWMKIESTPKQRRSYLRYIIRMLCNSGRISKGPGSRGHIRRRMVFDIPPEQLLQEIISWPYNRPPGV